ncbi:hypothetical protein JQU17_12855 [Ponticoccus sp. SC2-23]|uniref:hypothetical protein n=1 Tax=Alexandriicola marinus TaxID=2081710 RepID=UPI000FD89DE0|nr:hypothetical protein [Alexandriicola marinus]MBM1221116.1 hypothetical protein [Ponticoccus sp. SC6-9]MBM1225686.1 hypothetical protein [Ponticoccus sp. SC6-15]MBM1227838.1 hypothetical protein [Ponticoccus sp. SC6-38]MBM1234524.1 hypothetical protein [Ponticoccus sp. SC6-45]MBM1238340.1 hypothetical protein [Ponticoccus sp. SC6-49]MBM1243609.1 hypothetical protein [Ponticoccus sp. SC2-64]MBM1248048.1 hypothetical protein [Ponticoccus sp. SC6-42]MBM1252740.1 hypothetical protein [Pontico
MRLIFFLLVSLAVCLTTSVGELNAAEIEVVPGLDPNQKAILVRGPIEEGDDSRFFEIAEETPRATVVLESPGGIVSTGISIAAEIAIREYTTLVLDGSGCHSICAIMWVAGGRRYMSPDADISVHAAYRMRNSTDGSVETSESGMANAQIGAFLNEIGLSADAIRYFTFAGPNEELLDITPEIAQALSIDVYIQSSNGTISPSERPTPRRITRQVSEYIALAENCTTLFSVNGEFWQDQAKEVLDRGHRIFGGAIFAHLLGEYVAVTKADIRQQGFVRWCLSTEQSLRRDGLQTGILGPSYDCSRSSTRTEFAVCDTPDLWAMDRAMANLYFYYRENLAASRSQEFLPSQRAWLSRRDQCADDIACLYARYSSRLFDFGI